MKETIGKLLLILVTAFLFAVCPDVSSAKALLAQSDFEKIEQHINKSMKAGKIPGLSVLIIDRGETVYKKSFGYANVEKKEPITESTLFEIGSTSKAFTGLGILYLEKESLINLNDPVNKYIPWFRMKYKGEYVNITVSQCLYQTSGIPFKTIGDIPIASDGKALEKTVKNLVDQELENYPGERFLYATINYDILGLIIQYVTEDTYEEFILHRILKPLGLNEVLLDRAQAYSRKEMATGYKFGFLAPRGYYAPTFRGNTPAGYVIMNSRDLERWLKIQVLSIPIPDKYQELILKSHIPDRTVPPDSLGSSYAAGWEIHQKGTGEVIHAGGNPNFSSYIVTRPEDKIGVAVLANMSSDFTGGIGLGIMDIIKNRKMQDSAPDSMMSIDTTTSTVFIVSVLLIVSTIVFLVFFFLDVIRKRRKAIVFKLQNYIGIVLSLSFIAGLAYCLYLIPKILYNDLPWKFVFIWAPYSFIPCVIAVLITAIVFLTYFQFTYFFQKTNEKPVFPLIVLSFISGFGNAFIIFTINEALNRKNPITSGLLVYFFLGIVLYVLGQKLIRKKMINLMNDLIYSKRMEIIEKVLNTPYYKFEKIESGNIHAGLNNDTETIGQLPDVAIGALTGIVTLLCCFIYLGTVNFYGLLISIIIISFAAGLYYFMGKSADILWERTRDIQNVFFQFINDLIQGFKELSMKAQKRNDFKNDMEKSCDEYRQKNILASTKFINVFVIGELLFTFVIGSVAFIFPMIFDNIQANTLRIYIFVFIYMTGPVHAVLGNIPRLFRIRVSWKRINEFIEKIPQGSGESLEARLPEKANNVQDKSLKNKDNTTIEMKNVEYQYSINENVFTVGPIDLDFKSGEITFITGGNGSGKTTLAKLITGLYKPDSGSIIINNKLVNDREFGECYSVVFNDYYLFNKLYGIDYKEKDTDIAKYLKLLQIDKKLNVSDGKFSTLQLSGGQRKRIALLVSYLEDKQIFLFDEWAADQDPQFKKFFYEHLLPELRSRNKCVIAITHDDHYFNTADKVIKLDMGKVDEIKMVKE